MIPGGKGPGIDQETGAASFSGVLAAVPDLDPEIGYTVMQAIFDHAEDVRSLGVQFEDIRLDFGAKYLVDGFPINKGAARCRRVAGRSEEHTSELQSLMRISYAVFCLQKKKQIQQKQHQQH